MSVVADCDARARERMRLRSEGTPLSQAEATWLRRLQRVLAAAPEGLVLVASYGAIAVCRREENGDYDTDMTIESASAKHLVCE